MNEMEPAEGDLNSAVPRPKQQDDNTHVVRARLLVPGVWYLPGVWYYSYIWYRASGTTRA